MVPYFPRPSEQNNWNLIPQGYAGQIADVLDKLLEFVRVYV